MVAASSASTAARHSRKNVGVPGEHMTASQDKIPGIASVTMKPKPRRCVSPQHPSRRSNLPSQTDASIAATEIHQAGPGGVVVWKRVESSDSHPNTRKVTLQARNESLPTCLTLRPRCDVHPGPQYCERANETRGREEQSNRKQGSFMSSSAGAMRYMQ